MLDNYRDLIDQLIGTPTEVRALVSGAAVGAPTAALLIELRDRDELILSQLQEIMRTSAPYLRAAGPDAGATEPAAVLAGFESARGELVSLLMNLTLRDWERTAIHETDGEVSVVDLVEQHADFDEDHLTRLRQAASA